MMTTQIDLLIFTLFTLFSWRWKKFSQAILSNENEIQNLSSERNKKEELLDKIKNPYTTSSDVVLHKSYNFTGDQF